LETLLIVELLNKIWHEGDQFALGEDSIF